MNILDQARGEILKNSSLEGNLKIAMLRLIDYIEKYPNIKYFPLIKIKKITKSERNDTVLNIAIYLCGERIKILQPRYSYFVDNDTEIELTRDEFKYFIMNNDKCLRKNEYMIHPVIKEQLVMYFTTMTTYRELNESDDWDID